MKPILRSFLCTLFACFAALASAQQVDVARQVKGVLPVANGGSGAATLTGLVKGNGTSAFTAAVAKTDYAPATSGSAILKGDGSGGFAAASSGTDYAPSTSGSDLLLGNGSGGFSAFAGSSPSACSNQFMRAGAISAAGVLSLTCATVGTNDLASSLALTTPNIGAATGTSLSLNNAAGIPLTVYGYSTIGGAGATMGELRLGSDANAYGSIQIDTSGSTKVYIVNGYNNAGTGGIAMRVKGAGTPIDVATFDATGVSVTGTVAVNAGSNIVYYCNGGASVGNLCRGSGCSCSGGSWVATSLKVD